MASPKFQGRLLAAALTTVRSERRLYMMAAARSTKRQGYDTALAHSHWVLSSIAHRRGRRTATTRDWRGRLEEKMAATVGEMAPTFSLPGTTGPGLDLAELRGKGRAALFFYPADRTAG